MRANKKSTNSSAAINRLITESFHPPANGSKYTETELEELLGDIPKGSSELVEAHDLEYPVKRPGSTYHTLEEMIEDVRSKFSAGSEISVEMVQDAFR